MRVSAAEKESDGRGRDILLRWKKAVLVIDMVFKGVAAVEND